jgi:hypothetical protein
VKDPATIADAVHRVLTNDSLRSQLVAAGERRLRDFTLSESRRKLFDAITPIVGAPV